MCEGAGQLTDNEGEKTDCETCNGYGRFDLTSCPRQYVGPELSDEINLIAFANKGHLPEPGGLLDQPAKFVTVWRTLEADQNTIDQARREKR